MAKAKAKPEEKFQNIDFPLFAALEALDKKDYGFYDRLTEEQKKGFSSYMMTHWMSNIDSRNTELQQYYVITTNLAANIHLFNEYIMRHPKLQWYMLCAASLNYGKQYHKWLPHLSEQITKLKRPAKNDEVKEYFAKVYPKASQEAIKAMSEEYTIEQKKKVYLAKNFPELKHSDIETLCQITTDEDIANYERSLGN